MNVNGKTVVVTGAARGIGKAMCLRFAREGARVVVSDLDQEAANAVAGSIGGLGLACDVTREADIQSLVSRAENHFGPIDLFCSNAGVCLGEPDTAASASNAVWQTCWDIHVMAHVYAARAVLPAMIERGTGYFLQTVSAAGLLSHIGDAAYSATKHAAIGFAESLAITHGDDGIKVSVLCPQYVATPMLGYEEGQGASDLPDVIGPDDVASSVIQGLGEEVFIILPHPEVRQYQERKTADYDRWLGGMRKLRRHILKQIGTTRLEEMHKLI
jgi:NAD(P)-dependent dehydrogenase (short-subunit alcohol dehydrogenase family)